MKKRLLFLSLIVVVLLAMLPAVATAAPECVTTYYRVRPGDNLYRIASRHGVGMYALARANGITNLNLIYVGQVLAIPCTAPAPQPQPRPCFHIVGRGEWLSTIARRYGVSLWALIRANNISNPNRIYPGQRLVIPGCRPSPSPAPAPSPSPDPVECDITPVMGFGRLWTTNATLRHKVGCPQAQEYTADSFMQHFQYGIAIWREDKEKVTALYKNGKWGLLPDPWDDCQCYGPLVPYLGWPATGRWETQVAVQDFEGGTMLWTESSGIYVLYADGTWKQYD